MTYIILGDAADMSAAAAPEPESFTTECGWCDSPVTVPSFEDAEQVSYCGDSCRRADDYISGLI